MKSDNVTMQSNYKHYIYLYMDPNRDIPFYIGQGSTPTRWAPSQHLGDTHNNTLLTNRIMKIGTEKIKVYFLHTSLTQEEANKWEIYWIAKYGRRDQNKGTLCNLTDGGQGAPNLSEDGRSRISKANLGNSNASGDRTPKQKARIQSATLAAHQAGKGKRIGWHPTPEHIEHVASLKRGVKQSSETIEKRRLSLIGKKRSEEIRAKMRKPKSAEARANMSKAQKGRVLSPEALENVRKAAALRRGIPTGYKPSELTLAKLRERNKNYICSEDTKEKIRQSRLGTTLSDETKAKISLKSKGNTHNVGRKASPETKAKMSFSHVGFKMPPEAIEKTRQANIGRIVSDETKLKISLAKKGVKLSPETCKKLSLAKFGKPLSEEHKAKLRGQKHRPEAIERMRVAKRLRDEKDRLEKVVELIK
jgi:hypothetical protein